MFVKLTTTEGPLIMVRASRVQAFSGAADGHTLVMLSGTLSIPVTESLEEVAAALQATSEDR